MNRRQVSSAVTVQTLCIPVLSAILLLFIPMALHAFNTAISPSQANPQTAQNGNGNVTNTVTPRYAVIDLGTNMVNPMKITTSGYVLGAGIPSNGTNSYYVWHNGGTPLHLLPPDGAPLPSPQDIGEDGTVVGLETGVTATFLGITTNLVDYDGLDALATWTSGVAKAVLTPPPQIPVLTYTNAYVAAYFYPKDPSEGNTPEITLPGFLISPGGIWSSQLKGTTSEAGNEAGYTGRISDGYEGTNELGTVQAAGTANNPSSWSDTIMGTSRFPLAVNNSNQCLEEVDASYGPCSQFSPSWTPASTTYVLAGTTVPFVPLVGPGKLSNVSSLNTSYVLGSDTKSTVDGFGNVTYSSPTNYYCWDGTHQMILPPAAGSAILPQAVNAATARIGTNMTLVPATQIVGNFSTNAYLWEIKPSTNSTPVFNNPALISTFLATNSGWNMTNAASINDSGAIVGTATYSGTNTAIAAGSHGVMLVPITITQSNYPTPSTADSTTDSGATTSKVIVGAGATDGIALITGGPAMPQLTAQIGGFTSSGMTVDWRAAITSERTERGTKDNFDIPFSPGEGGPATSGGAGVVDNQPINTPWNIPDDYPASPQSFFGGNVTVYFTIKTAAGTPLGPEQSINFKIRGLNPLDATAKNFITTTLAGGANSDVFQFAWAVVQHESREGNKVYNQFNPSGSSAELPDYGAPDGWGIAQLDTPLGVSANTEQVYNWQLNINTFYQEIDEKIAAQQRFFAAVAAAYPSDPDAQNPPQTTLYGQSMSALAAGAITLYNGVGAPPGGTPCPTTTLGGVTYQNPWTFTHSPASGQPKWQYYPNGYDYLHQVVEEYLGETFQE